MAQQHSPIRLRTAAQILVNRVASDQIDQRIARMAATPSARWTEQMTTAAAQILTRWTAQLADAGYDTSALIEPANGSGGGGRDAVAAAVAAMDEPARTFHGPARPKIDPTVPFAFDHTIDGLRGITVDELAAVRGPKQAAALTKYGLGTVYDVLAHVPRRYLDRTTITPLNELVEGDEGTSIAHVVASAADTFASGMRAAKITIEDRSSGMRIGCTFFNQPWRSGHFKPGDEVVVSGRLDSWTNERTGQTYWQMKNPMLARTGEADSRIVPIYPQSKERANVSTWMIHRAAMEAVGRMGTLTDPVPADLVTGGPHWMDRTAAYRNVHAPQHMDHVGPARDRLAYDELLRLQLALRMRRVAEQATGGIAHAPTGALTRPLIEALPFPLTGAQQQALTEIGADLRRPVPMHRLVQGDVGVGKTLVAILAMLVAVEGGYQAALMAPTEVLASQHHAELIERLSGLTRPDGTPIRVAALTNKVQSKARRATLAGLADGSIDIVVGTHALISDEVRIPRLGLAVVDEQHRFGVEQRAALTATGDHRADLLVMTATPIPRTAAMTVFGDLDVTIIDEKPPGRTPIRTEWIDHAPDTADPDEPVWAKIREQVAQGHQCYVVCPLVEDSETKAAASAQSTAAELEAGALAGLRIGLVHGKQKPDERDLIMAAFKVGDIDVLVATTVIEVGISVPNATCIVILEPKQFGMAQLHQLRGRVGRGKAASMCLLAGAAGSTDTEHRLGALVATDDGFELSEVDLRLRGPGSVLGTAQSGMTDLRVADLSTDTTILSTARADAAAIVDVSSDLSRFPGLRAEVANALGPDADKWLTAS